MEATKQTKGDKAEKGLGVTDKLHMMYLAWVSVGSPNPDINFIAEQLNVKAPAARMRFNRLRQELEKAGLPSTKDVSSPSKSSATEGDKLTAVNKQSKGNGKGGKKGKRKATAEETEIENDHTEKKIKAEEEEEGNADADLVI